MPTWLPVPRTLYPRNEQDLATISERLGGQVSLHIARKRIEKKAVPVSGKPATRAVPAFVEWWLEYPADFIPPSRSEPPAPPDRRVHDFLGAVAGIAARSWSAEIDSAKGWPPEPEPPITQAQQLVFTAPTTKGRPK
jgi:hypothetical protein